MIGAILAETKTEAQRAAKAVYIHYEELHPIITIEVLVIFYILLFLPLICIKFDQLFRKVVIFLMWTHSKIL